MASPQQWTRRYSLTPRRANTPDTSLLELDGAVVRGSLGSDSPVERAIDG